MATSRPNSQFLSISREIRNKIYDELLPTSVQKHVGYLPANEPRWHRFCLNSLLLVCGQVHDEILEHLHVRSWAHVKLPPNFRNILSDAFDQENANAVPSRTDLAFAFNLDREIPRFSRIRLQIAIVPMIINRPSIYVPTWIDWLVRLCLKDKPETRVTIEIDIADLYLSFYGTQRYSGFLHGGSAWRLTGPMRKLTRTHPNLILKIVAEDRPFNIYPHAQLTDVYEVDAIELEWRKHLNIVLSHLSLQKKCVVFYRVIDAGIPTMKYEIRSDVIQPNVPESSDVKARPDIDPAEQIAQKAQVYVSFVELGMFGCLMSNRNLDAGLIPYDEPAD